MGHFAETWKLGGICEIFVEFSIDLFHVPSEFSEAPHYGTDNHCTSFQTCNSGAAENQTSVTSECCMVMWRL